MNRRASAALALALLFAALSLACTSGRRPENEIIERHVRFICDNKEEVEMRFFPREGTAVLVRHGRTIELKQQPSGSGFLYSNGPNTVRGKGNEITVEVGRMVPLKCKAV
jgi:membrane-bound inhibitor of C-type lysozyme